MYNVIFINFYWLIMGNSVGYRSIKKTPIPQSLNTLYDASLSIDEGTGKLEEFFNLLLLKRGYGTALVKNIKVFQRESNSYDSAREEQRSSMREGFQKKSYLSWHYIEVEMTPEDNPDDEVFRRFLGVLNSNSAGIYFELRGYSWFYNLIDKHFHCTIDVHLNDANALDKFIVGLKREDNALSGLVKAIIDQENSESALVLAAHVVLNELYNAQRLGVPVNAVAYHTKQVLVDPKLKNIKQLKQTLGHIELGKRREGLAIFGAVVAFLGVVCIATGAPLMLTGISIAAGLSLLAVGIAILIAGLALINSVQEKGLRASVHHFFKNAVNVVCDNSPPIQATIPR